MEKTFVIRTVATVTYDNYCSISEELWKQYKEEYPDATDEQLASIMFYEEGHICDESNPVRWDNEEITNVWEET